MTSAEERARVLGEANAKLLIEIAALRQQLADKTAACAEFRPDAERYQKARDGLRWLLSPGRHMSFEEVDAYYDAARKEG